MKTMTDQCKTHFLQALTLKPYSQLDYCSLRLVENNHEFIGVKKNVLQPVEYGEDTGLMICVIHQGGLGYAAANDISAESIEHCLKTASHWASLCRQHTIHHFSADLLPHSSGTYQSPIDIN